MPKNALEDILGHLERKEMAQFLAMQLANKQLTNALIDKGIAKLHPNLNIVNGDTLAHVFVRNVQAYSLLSVFTRRGAGVDLSTTNAKEQTPLDVAIDQLNISAIKVLCSQSQNHINTRDNFGETALHKAVKSNNSAKLMQCLHLGADANITDLGGKLPLQLCFERFDNIDEDAASVKSYTEILNSLVKATNVTNLQKLLRKPEAGNHKLLIKQAIEAKIPNCLKEAVIEGDLDKVKELAPLAKKDDISALHDGFQAILSEGMKGALQEAYIDKVAESRRKGSDHSRSRASSSSSHSPSSSSRRNSHHGSFRG